MSVRRRVGEWLMCSSTPPGGNLVYQQFMREIESMNASAGGRPMNEAEQRVDAAGVELRTAFGRFGGDFWQGGVIVAAIEKFIRAVIREERGKEAVPVVEVLGGSFSATFGSGAIDLRKMGQRLAEEHARSGADSADKPMQGGYSVNRSSERTLQFTLQHLRRSCAAGRAISLGHSLAEALRDHIDGQAKELEQLRMQLSACGVAAMENTRAGKRLDRDSPYWSASYSDVCTAVDREIAVRERCEGQEKEIEEHKEMYRIQTGVLKVISEARDTAIKERDSWQRVKNEHVHKLEIALRDAKAQRDALQARIDQFTSGGR